MTKRHVSYRGFLEVEIDGKRCFVHTNKILASPALQDACIEKAELRRIQKRLARALADSETTERAQ